MRFSRLSALVGSIAAVLGTTYAAAAPTVPTVVAKTSHPYLFATQQDIDALQARLRPVLPVAGTVELKFTPAKKSLTGLDADGAVIFGSQADSVSHIVFRYLDGDQDNRVTVQFRLNNGAGVVLENKTFPLSTQEEATIRMTFAGPNQPIKVKIGPHDEFEVDARDWNPSLQQIHMVGRKGQQTASLLVKDSAGNVTWDGSGLDWEVAGARYGFLANYAPSLARKIIDCPKSPINPQQIENVCNVATAGRLIIAEAAKDLSLAYKLTGDPIYVTAAKSYVDWILKMRDYKGTGLADFPGQGLGTHNEWAMSARLATLGVLYDWFHAELDDKADTTRKAKMRSFIVDTVTTRTGGNDLVRSICSDAVGFSTTSFDCAGPAQIEKYYISGHNASAMTGTAIALLAIVNDDSNVAPLINTIYGHLVNGLLPARNYISQDGGHQTLFFYNSNAGEVLERLVMWERALASASQPISSTEFVPKLITPYIYGMRKGNSFPALADNDAVSVIDGNIGAMALAGALRGNGYATAFYEDYVVAGRNRATTTGLWEALLFQGTRAMRPAQDPDLAAHLRVAGNVFMRDTWVYNDATLLDFKSSKFSSENHHHFDQNSFSLFYKSPLLLDTGIYDSYNSSHWYNYYRRTVAHNSIVVFDKAEVFSPAAGNSNDGGQIVRGVDYPTLAQIKDVNGSNTLDGIDFFENRARFAYVRGNASKAYRPGPTPETSKLDPVDGFRRSILYIRPAPDTDGAHPTILVYDRVHSPLGLPATSLLHTAERPAVSGGYRAAVPAVPGRYAVMGAKNAPLVVRNGDGMLTIEPLLPAYAHIHVVGGKPGEGTVCPQIDLSTSDDCRFMVRRVKDNTATWVNFPPSADKDKAQADAGAWRIEISPSSDTSTAKVHYQYFLNVLRVAGNDRDTSAPTANTAVLLKSNDGTTHAVYVDAETTAVFSTSFKDADAFRWTTGQEGNVNVIVMGAVPGASYTGKFNADTQEWVLRMDAVFNPSNLVSSANGVIEGRLTR